MKHGLLLIMLAFLLISCSDPINNDTSDYSGISTLAGERFLISNDDQDLLSFYNYFCSGSQITSSNITDTKGCFISRFREKYVSFGDDYELRRAFAMGVYFIDNYTKTINYSALVSGFYKEDVVNNNLILYITNVYKEGSVYFDAGAISPILGEGNENVINVPLVLIDNKADLSINDILYSFIVYNEKGVYLNDDKTVELAPVWFSQNE